MKTLAAALALLLVACAAPAAAQPTPTGLSIVASGAGTVPYKGSGAFPFSVKVGCATLVANALEDVNVTLDDAPAWLTVTPTTFTELSPMDCDPATGQLTVDGTLAFSVSEKAPAVRDHIVHLVAQLGDTTSENSSAPFQVAYKSDYTLVPSAQFPLTVTNVTTKFMVTGTQASNAPSMIMVDDFSADSGASVSGIGAQFYNNEAGNPTTKTYVVTFTAPKGEWTKATATLKVYGHYNFDGKAGPPEDRRTITWEFVNGGVVQPDDKGGKDSPAPVGALTALGLLGLAAVLRRKA